MTLQEFMTEQKILVSEYQAFRDKTAHPDYHLCWNNYQWNNRRTGRTQLSDVERFALGRILYDIRHPGESIKA